MLRYITLALFYTHKVLFYTNETLLSYWNTSTSVLPPGKLDETYVSSLLLAHLLHYVKTTSYTKPKYIAHCTAIRGGPRHGYRWQVLKIWGIWTLGSWNMRADRQRDR